MGPYTKKQQQKKKKKLLRNNYKKCKYECTTSVIP